MLNYNGGGLFDFVGGIFKGAGKVISGALKGGVGGFLAGGPKGALAGAGLGAITGLFGGGQRDTMAMPAGYTATQLGPQPEPEVREKTDWFKIILPIAVIGVAVALLFTAMKK